MINFKFKTVWISRFAAFFITLLLIGSALIMFVPNNAEAKFFYDVSLSADKTAQDADRENYAYYKIKVSNIGENDDRYQLTFTNPKSDTWIVTFENYFTDTPEIAVSAGTDVIVNLTVRPSCGCEEGNSLKVDITAYSKTDQSTFASITVDTTYKMVNGGTDPNNGGDDDKDSDNDGVSDAVEQYSGTDPNDGSDYPKPGDTDNDGYTDEDEKFYGTNPYDKSDFPVDSDNDGLTDAREKNLGTDPNRRDTDGDGDSDYKEVIDGTSPTDPNESSSSKSTGEDSSSNDEKGIFGVNSDDNLFFVIIPILIIVVVVSLVLLLYVWRNESPGESKALKPSDEFDDERVDKDSELGKERRAKKASTAIQSKRVEVIDTKLEKAGNRYKCPECGRQFKTKSLKKHLLRSHHKRHKRL